MQTSRGKFPWRRLSLAELAIIGILWLAAVLAASAYIVGEGAGSSASEGGCSPKPDNCLRTLLILARQSLDAPWVSVQGNTAPTPNAYEYSRSLDVRWYYDRRHGVVVQFWIESEVFGFKCEWRGAKLIYHGVTDALLDKFAQSTAPREYDAEFEKFCKVNGCRVVVADGVDDATWNVWRYQP